MRQGAARARVRAARHRPRRDGDARRAARSGGAARFLGHLVLPLRGDAPGAGRDPHAWASRGVAFVGINSDGGGATLDEIKSFLAAHHIPYPVVIDDGTVGALYKVEALPSLVVIGRDGRIRKSFVGYTTEGRSTRPPRRRGQLSRAAPPATRSSRRAIARAPRSGRGSGLGAAGFLFGEVGGSGGGRSAGGCPSTSRSRTPASRGRSCRC